MSADNPDHAWLDGRLVPWEDARLPLEDRGVQFAESLYEVVPVTRSRARRIEDHVGRMRRGAEAIGLADGVPELATWERMAAALVETGGVTEGLLYAQVTGGSAPRRYVPERRPVPRFFAYLRPHRFPREDRVQRGIRVVTYADPRWRRADLKTTMLLPTLLAKREAMQRGADDALLLGPDGEVREGASSNVFVVEGQTVCTPVQNDHLLPGTTRSLVGLLAGKAGLQVADATIPLRRLLDADEVFVTATSLLVMAVVAVDGRPVGGGRAGPVTLDLARRLRRRFELDDL